VATFPVETPFGDKPLEEIDLPSAPLVKVIAQLRYPQLASMADDTVARTFARLVSKDYPIIQEAREVNLIIGVGAPGQQEQLTRPVWRLQNTDGDLTVTLGQTSLALETTAYRERREFCASFINLAQTFMGCASPPRFERLGIRYVNRIATPETLAKVTTLVRPEIIGIGTLELPSNMTLHHALIEAQFDHGSSTLLTKSGFLPPGGTVDPSMPPVETNSWILDIDSFMSGALPASESEIESTLNDLAKRAYRFFRYCVSDDFLDIFGG
jgi:uncharacterized protein (TIGR04255 family)